MKKKLKLRELNKQMKTDGHSEEFRLNITKKVVDEFKTAVDEDKAGVKHFFRTRKGREKNNVGKKKGDKVDWYKRRG